MRAIGIDLGTTNSCVSIYEGDHTTVIPGPDGKYTMPSVVAVTESGQLLVGAPAKRQITLNPFGTVSSVKRLMGRRPNEMPKDLGNMTAPVTADGNKIKIQTGERSWVPQELSAQILRQLKENAERWLSEEVTDAVITVPAYFNDAQRQATIEAGKIAGLNVLRIINEPTAAALAYGLDKTDVEQTVLVFDLGGGTFDVSILEIVDGVFEVKATAGDNNLGGDDFDQVIVDWMLAELKQEHDVDISQDKKALQRLYEAAEKAKQELSGMIETSIDLPFLSSHNNQPIHFVGVLSRAQFESLAAKLIERVTRPTMQVLKDAGMQNTDIDQVLLVGGMTRMPAISEQVAKLLGKEPARNINPDEAVAMGAAVQAHVLAGGSTDILLLDVTPLSLGIETRGGIYTRLIDRNTTIPTRISEIFTTAEDNQNNVEVHILQGEREMASDNRTLARLYLQDIPPAPRGVPQIQVSFQIDADGILQVTAKDLGTGQDKTLRIEGGSDLGSRELQDMINQAESERLQDIRVREQAQMRNNIESLAYSSERALRLYGDKLDASSKERLTQAIHHIREALLTGVTQELLDNLAQELEEASYAISEHLYAYGDLEDNEELSGPPDLYGDGYEEAVEDVEWSGSEDDLEA